MLLIITAASSLVPHTKTPQYPRAWAVSLPSPMKACATPTAVVSPTSLPRHSFRIIYQGQEGLVGGTLIPSSRCSTTFGSLPESRLSASRASYSRRDYLVYTGPIDQSPKPSRAVKEAARCNYTDYVSTYVTYPSKGLLPFPRGSVDITYGCEVWGDIVNTPLLVNLAFNIVSRTPIQSCGMSWFPSPLCFNRKEVKEAIHAPVETEWAEFTPCVHGPAKRDREERTGTACPLTTTRQRSQPLWDGQREPARTAKLHDTDDNESVTTALARRPSPPSYSHSATTTPTLRHDNVANDSPTSVTTTAGVRVAQNQDGWEVAEI
ncbi:hypothetical protein PAXINDRAFT_13831 [Paxillus involutus ATCC 200175]|uniref:Uncharacterized protein n=1 Tax=Paxillus involutus ATCC 200175 TaxID=664439 RepID=A0A0C9SVC4_PAXIN|nr:hypothetical protein PAXINDRAFT_13831 [Paxillus involutus ATCC 200175]